MTEKTAAAQKLVPAPVIKEVAAPAKVEKVEKKEVKPAAEKPAKKEKVVAPAANDDKDIRGGGNNRGFAPRRYYGHVEMPKVAPGEDAVFDNGASNGFRFRNAPTPEELAHLAKSKIEREITDKELSQLPGNAVVVFGHLLTPAETGRVLRRGDLESRDLFPSSYHLISGQAVDPKLIGAEFDLYRFNLNGRHHTIYVGGDSKVNIKSIGDDCYYDLLENNREGINRDGPALVVLYNSESDSDTFFGESSMVNVKTTACMLSSSHLVVNPESEESKASRPWGFAGGGSGVHKIEVGESYERVQLEQSSAIDCKLTGGAYYFSHLTKTKIRSNTFVKTRRLYSNHTSIIGNNIFLGGVTVNNSLLKASRDVRIANQTLEGVSIDATGIFARNKFAITKIDLPNNWVSELNLVRVSPTEVELSTRFNRSSVTIEIGDDQWSISERIENWMKTDEANLFDSNRRSGKVDDDVIIQSIIRYVTDTITSRLNVIRTLDRVMEMAQEIEGDKNYRHEFNGF